MRLLRRRTDSGRCKPSFTVEAEWRSLSVGGRRAGRKMNFAKAMISSKTKKP
jgi:hypothetical protein